MSIQRTSQRALAFVLALSAAACTRTDAGEAPEAGTPAAEATAPDAANRPERAETPTDAASAAPTVPAGTSLVFVVDQSVSTSDHDAGHRFTGTLIEDVAGVDGGTALPAGTVGRWAVTESTKDNGEGQAVLAVMLEAIQLEGTWYPVIATVTGTESKTDTRDSGGETAAKIGIGAAAGALAGKILGGSTEATLKGAGVGAAMGTVVALATRGGSASIPQGSRITVRLEEKVELAPG